MWVFDASLRYQFAVFLGEAEKDLDEDIVTKIPECVRAAVDGVDELMLRFRPPSQTQSVTVGVNRGPGVQVIGLQWPSSGNIWRLDWQPGRLDLHFDALAYSELYDQHIALNVVVRRVAANLARLREVLAAPITRTALIASGESRSPALPAAAVVARRFFNEELIALAQNKPEKLPDLSARTNRRESWELKHVVDDEPQPIEINCVEAAQAVFGAHAPRPSHRQLIWQVDINTVPIAKEVLSQESAELFFERAAEWVQRTWPTVDSTSEAPAVS